MMDAMGSILDTGHSARRVRIVLSGPESSGKSTLARRLAAHFGVPVATEYARVFLEAGNPCPPSLDALTELAHQHLAWQQRHVPADVPCGIYDTDLLNYWLWADVAFGRVPEEIDVGLAAEAHHIHLLCEPDLTWQPDPLREFPDLEKRRMLFRRHREEIERRGMRYHLICGEGDARFAVAAAAFKAARAAASNPAPAASEGDELGTDEGGAGGARCV